MRNTQRLHFVGIGGIGMSGIAEILLNLGYAVSGSDLVLSNVTGRLQQQGATVYQGHAAAQVQGADVVVISSAVQPDNIEVLTARAQHIPVIPRAEMLAELMRMKYGVAIAGTHGKTTTTSLVATILAYGGLDPTVLIGGRLNSLGSNAKLGQGEYLVAEADESDGSFLLLSPTVSVVTTVDAEHLDFYGDLAAVQRAFVQFINKVPFYGCSIICLDQPHIRSLVPQIRRRCITYGLTSQADYMARDLRLVGLRSHFEVFRTGERLGQFSLNLPGTHNVANALAAIAVGVELDIPLPAIAQALEEFSGVQRRFDRRGVRDGITVVDDYGHHPEEIRQTLRAAKAVWPEARLVVVFQPHRYTRTHLLLHEFCTAFHDAGALVLLDIYAAGETPLPGVTTGLLYEGLISQGQRQVYYLRERAEVVPFLQRYLHANDILLTLGAGDVWQVGEAFLHATGEA
ncbi:MAG TPA: UDP-N-acetylmuramate--L-alanine ligase [Candidatus Saccharimonadia bacterium]|nr:UDP-N-acetylmuramate--L-alanine ligase [Candidatus Saccharimonadia bacterium]